MCLVPQLQVSVDDVRLTFGVAFSVHLALTFAAPLVIIESEAGSAAAFPGVFLGQAQLLAPTVFL